MSSLSKAVSILNLFSLDLLELGLADISRRVGMDCTPIIRQVGLGEFGGVGRYSVE